MSETIVPARYRPALRWLHWIMFALVLLAYLFINLHHYLPRGSEERAAAVHAHFLAGLGVLLLVLPRVWLRSRSTRPPITPPQARWADRLASATHLALYAFLLVQPLLGLATAQIGGKAISVFGVRVFPQLVEHTDRALSHQLEHIHGTIGTVFYWIIGLHIAAALWHHFARRDDTLKRMW
jgi:cytochrome b561